MNKNCGGLVAKYLIAGALAFGGCSGANSEHHEGKASFGTFKMNSKLVGNNYYGDLDLVSFDKKERHIIKTVGGNLSSEEEFNVVSYKIYVNSKLEYDALPNTDFSKYGSMVKQQFEIIFREGSGRFALAYGMCPKPREVFFHLRDCDGKYPCRVPSKK